MRFSSAIFLVGTAVLSGCAGAPSGDVTDDEPADFVAADGKADGTFDPNDTLSDAEFADQSMSTGDAIQAFFEQSPYGHRCWLADAQIGDQRAADAIAAAAQAHNVNALLLLTRMQVEKSLISKATEPTNIDYALGCHDPSVANGLSAAVAPMDVQLACGSNTLAKLFAASEDGSGAWREGKAKDTLDPVLVTPATNATAALYAYTPWVLEGRGGNWLHYNVFTKFSTYVAAQR